MVRNLICDNTTVLIIIDLQNASWRNLGQCIYRIQRRLQKVVTKSAAMLKRNAMLTKNVRSYCQLNHHQ